MIILGLSFANHDSAAALVADGNLVRAIAQERLTRRKHDGILGGRHRTDLSEAVRYCLESAALTLDDVDLVVYSHATAIDGQELFRTLEAEGGLDLRRKPLIALPHHFAHACLAAYQSPFDEAAVLVMDGGGQPYPTLLTSCSGPELEDLASGSVALQTAATSGSGGLCEVESYYAFKGGRLLTLRKVLGQALRATVGPQYSAATEVLFGNPLDCGKTMGLAPYGTPLDQTVFLDRIETGQGPLHIPKRPGLRLRMETEIGRWRARAATDIAACAAACDYAATLQRETEAALLAQSRWLHRATGLPNLCLGGGVALNCVANSVLARESGFQQVFVPYAPGDDGIAIGCALYGAVVHGEHAQRQYWSPYLGREYTDPPAGMPASGTPPVTDNPWVSIGTGEPAVSLVADLLAAGQIVAFFQQGSEFGPRALGHRSFLADPRDPGMVERLNLITKHREPFRPFAPVVMAEAVSEYFEDSFPSHYMSFVSRVRPSKRHLIPSVTHVDGTARYQVLGEQTHPDLYHVLRAFRRKTGIPMLINTSYNRARDPLVESPRDACACAHASQVDLLLLEGHLCRLPHSDQPQSILAP
ncbi:MAG: hypothetical protein H7A45_03765 [Verrucomicrobiales bacterium]|nr:hypothetical protein [Verrucomicrobiales bacterium]